MTPTLLDGYPDRVGRRFIWAGDGAGPKSYSQTTGDVVSLPGYQNYVDSVDGPAISLSGNYWVIPRTTTKGARANVTLHWYTAGGFTEVSNATDLSGETVRLSGKGGTF